MRAEPNLLESDNEDLQPDITLIVPIFGCSPLDHDDDSSRRLPDGRMRNAILNDRSVRLDQAY